MNLFASVVKHTTEHTWVDRGWYLVTEFEKTPSINFCRAVELAQTHPGFVQLMDERNVLIYRNVYRPNNLVQFQAISKLISRWKGSKLYLKGHEVEFDSIASGVQCYIQTQLPPGANPAPEQCGIIDLEQFAQFPPAGCIGCRRSGVSLLWQPDVVDETTPCWFFFGTIDRHKVYHIHKEELENTVIGHLIEYQSCPRLDIDQITALIRRFPDRIDPRKDPEWQYQPTSQDRKNLRRYHLPEITPVNVEAYHAYLERKVFRPG
jgi:hypothetical protein